MKWVLVVMASFIAGSLFFISCSKSQAPPAAGPVTFDWDKGPADIDVAVAKYPKDQQAVYNDVIKAKCTQCHPLGRVLWAPYYDEATWTKIVTKMANRPGSQVGNDDVSKVVKFLVYDHIQRKAAIEKAFQDNHWQTKDPVL